VTTTGTGRQLFWAAALVGLIVRVAIVWNSASLGPVIVDEQHYVTIASNLVAGHGFAATPGEPTSIRPPLFPGLLAGLWMAAGAIDFQLVRIVQVVLSALTAWLVYLLGRMVWSGPVGAGAAAVTWVYPSFIFFNVTILTETLFTLLLLLFLVVAVQLVKRPHTRTALACGAALGLATLTRSVLWPLPVLLCPLLALAIEGSLARRAGLAVTVLLGFVVVIAPWAIRNTRLQGVTTIVDTMGGINLRMGNYEHTPDDRMWDAVSLTGERNWVRGIEEAYPDRLPTEGEKDKWAQARAIEYIVAHPGPTARRALIKVADFWGIEREFVAGVRAGLFTPPAWFTAIAGLATAIGYVMVALAGAIGIWMAAPAWRMQALLLLPIVAIMSAHAIVFGHSRYHIPLVPILALYGIAFVRRPAKAGRPRRPIAAAGAAMTAGLLMTIWIREVVFVEGDRIRDLIERF
jgi:4-amino-4-deoxy-L-arabinose transferase-like glycosyltransferase